MNRVCTASPGGGHSLEKLRVCAYQRREGAIGTKYIFVKKKKWGSSGINTSNSLSLGTVKGRIEKKLVIGY